jgi:hypothetical protein
VHADRLHRLVHPPELIRVAVHPDDPTSLGCRSSFALELQVLAHGA